MAHIFKIIGIILILFIAGCRKEDDLNLPVKTHLTIQFKPYETIDFNESRFYNFAICMMGIEKIEFEGIREEGENIFFSTDLGINLPVTLAIPNLFNQAIITDIDLPSGIYKYIRLDIYFKPIDEAPWKIIEGADTINPGMVIKGRYHYIEEYREDTTLMLSLYTIPVDIAIDQTETLTFRSLGEAIIKQPECEISLLINLNKFFASIDHTSIEEAEISEIPGDGYDERIIISSNNNRDLYEILLHQLGLSTSLVVRQTGTTIP